MRSLFVLMALSLFAFALPEAIEEKIRQSGIAKKDITLYIKEAGKKGREVATLHAYKTRTPASVIKLLTTYAAVLKLGFDYRWQTKFFTTGRVQNGVLYGDLVIKGFGDPTLGDADLEKIVSYIRAEGIRAIEGNIVIDRSYFKVGNRDSSGFDENPHSPYNAMPDAMMFNERVSTICVTARKRKVEKERVDHSYEVVDKLQYVNRSCRGKYAWPRVKIDKSTSIPKVILHGKLSRRCGKQNICRVLTKPYKSFYYALKDELAKQGVRVKGRLKLAKVPADAKELFSYYSDKLEKIVSKTSKKSNNLYARHLMLLLGAKLYGAPATLQKGRDAIIKILSSKGALGEGVLYIDNGSGLSRHSKLNAKLLADMLDDAYERYGQRWMETLSIAGVDGTIKKRFRGTVVRKRAWMKTGTLRRVKNIAGYVKSTSGKVYTVVIIINSTKAKYRGAKLQNEIIKWIAKGMPQTRQKPQQTSAPKAKPKQQQAALHAAKKPYYYVQVGSFKRKPSQKYLRKIAAQGLPYKVDKNSIYKVLIGPYKQERTARQVLKRVKAKLNRSAFVTKQ